MGNHIYTVCQGAELKCTLGTMHSFLQIPVSNGAILTGEKEATIANHIGFVNILPFCNCTRAVPPPPCTPTIIMKWLKGKKDVRIKDELSLLNICIVPCVYGGIISIVDHGQKE